MSYIWLEICLFLLFDYTAAQTIYVSPCEEDLLRRVSDLQMRVNILENQISQEKACKKSPGYLDKFTEYMNKLHAGKDITWKYTRPGTRKEKLNECKNMCLAHPQCKAYEFHLYDGRCSIESINKWDVPLESHSSYVYYNRDYDCGCAPCKGRSITENQYGTGVGSIVSCISTVNGKKSQFVCTPSGWKPKGTS